MLQTFINRFLAPRHYWRTITFDELGELYVSMMFRSLALSLIGIFVPIFLLTSGYSLPTILWFYVCFFVIRTGMDIVAGRVIARFGPKHTMLISYIAQIVASVCFMTLNTYDWPLLLPAFFFGTANSFFFLAFHVDFSKVKHSKHAGKELGYVNIMEKIGGIIGPITGGVVSVLFGPQYIFLCAVVLLLAGLIPLFKTAEPVKLRQKLDYKGLDLSPHKRDLVSYIGLTTENNLCITLWPLFLALFVLRDNIYLTFGALSSLSVCAAALAAFSVGKLVDEKKGGLLLQISTVLSAVLYAVRPFVSTVLSAGLIGAAKDAVTVGFRIPYHKGMYDVADSLPGHRIAYLVVMESLSSFAKAVVWLHLYIFSYVLASRQLMYLGFAIAAGASLLILLQRFKALEYAKST